MDLLDVYISDVRIFGQSWVEDADAFLDSVYNTLVESPNVGLVNIAINMAQVYNVNIKEANYDSMTMYIKGVKYKHKEFLSHDEAEELVAIIRQQLLKIEGVTLGEIEIRSSKIYTDQQLGLVVRQTLPAGSAPVILERS